MSKQSIPHAVERRSDTLIQLADRIHGFAEVKFEEHRSASALTDFLEGEGFEVTRGTADLETAFIARYGSGGPTIAYLAEYDALVGLGHGCGHNLIGPASLGAAVALKERIEEEELEGTVLVIGTPGEEGGAGKVIMVERGVFEEVDFVMMVHALNRTVLDYGTIAVAHVTAEFFGRASHASVEPEKGRNALDAVIQVFTGVNSMRQQVTQDVRMHGVITKGGDAPNVIPDYTSTDWLLRTDTAEKLDDLIARFEAVVQGAATMTGCTAKFTIHHRYKPRIPNQTMLGVFDENLRSIGIESEPPPSAGGRGSSDMGDVSQVVPTIQCYLRIADDDVPWHSPEVVRLSKMEVGHSMMLNGAKVLGLTGYDILRSEQLQRAIRDEFAERFAPA